MQEAFHTLKSSFYDSKNTNKGGDINSQQYSSLVEAIVQREVQGVHQRISSQQERNNQSMLQSVSQMMQAH